MKLALPVLLVAMLGLSARASEWIPDPSMVPSPRGPLHCGERFRLIADFNGDGIPDLALSSDTSEFGNAGGVFTLYLQNERGLYREHGQFRTNPETVSLERIGPKVRLWLFHRLGGWIGQIGFHEGGEDGLSDFRGITIHPGDSGTPMGRAMAEAVFRNSDLPIQIQLSVTQDGVVRWMDPRQARLLYREMLLYRE